MITHPVTFAQIASLPPQKGILPLCLLSLCAFALSVSAEERPAPQEGGHLVDRSTPVDPQGQERRRPERPRRLEVQAPAQAGQDLSGGHG